MSFNVAIDQNAAQAAESAREALPSGDFPPILRGAYPAMVLENMGVEDFTSKPDNPNYGLSVARLKVQTLEGLPYAAKRVFFVRVPLFSRYAPNPNAKTDEGKTIGASARMFWNFFTNVMGLSEAEIIERGKPGGGGLPSNVEGKLLTIIVGAPKKPDNYNPLGYSEVDGVDAPMQDFSKVPVKQPGQSAAPWLTPDDVLIPGHPALGGGASAGGPAVGGPVGPGAPIAGHIPAPGAPISGPGVAPMQTGYAQPPAPAYNPAAGGFAPGAPAGGFAPGQAAAPGFAPGQPQTPASPEVQQYAATQGQGQGVPPQWAAPQGGVPAGVEPTY